MKVFTRECSDDFDGSVAVGTATLFAVLNNGQWECVATTQKDESALKKAGFVDPSAKKKAPAKKKTTRKAKK